MAIRYNKPINIRKSLQLGGSFSAADTSSLTLTMSSYPNGSTSIDKSGSCSNGDIVIGFFVGYGVEEAQAANAPSGWTRISFDQDVFVGDSNDTHYTITTFYKIISGTSWSWDHPSVLSTVSSGAFIITPSKPVTTVNILAASSAINYFTDAGNPSITSAGMIQDYAGIVFGVAGGTNQLGGAVLSSDWTATSADYTAGTMDFKASYKLKNQGDAAFTDTTVTCNAPTNGASYATVAALRFS